MINLFDMWVQWMQNNESKVMIAVLVLILVAGCTALNRKANLKDDNFFEETIEELIEAKTGLDIDLTPSSPEK